MGEVRARATCQRDGKTVTAQTDYFSVVDNETVTVGDFYQASEQAPPVDLQVNFGRTLDLYGEGASRQVTIIARYANSVEKSLDPTTPGINYSISSPNVATVDNEGVVTAVATGQALLTVRLDGAIGIINIKVVDFGDKDGDGIPDLVETNSGLDPNDPIDAFEDQDGDGLSALEEYQLGTKIQLADSDGDSISDGEEVAAGEDGFVTNPLLFDTDGDGLNDGVELTVGSDPTDGEDANYGALITNIEVEPGSAVLFYNTIDSESSLQLKVTATLVDGTAADITSVSRGTNYSSSDLTIANFGIESGRVYAGQDGIATVTVTNGDFSAEVQVTVVTFTPQPLGYIELTSQANNVVVEGSTAYVATEKGLSIVDLSDPKAPFVAGELSLGAAKDVKVSGGVAYLATQSGLAMVNINNPTEPFVLATYTDAGQVNDIALENNKAYLATEASGLVILDISSPQAAAELGRLQLGSVLKSVAVEGELAVVISGDVVIAVGVTVASSPTELGRASVSGAQQVAIKGQHAFVAAGSGTYYPSVDLTNPTLPVVNETPRDFVPTDVVVRGDHAFYADTVFPSAVPIVNIKDPNNPLYQALIDMSRFGDYDCNGIDADLSYTYCTARNRLYINQYRELQDIAGIAPTITWEQPDFGKELFQSRPYRVSVQVEDDVRVAVVNFFANDELVHTDITPPYTFVYKVPDAIEQLSFRVEALDLAGNLGSTGGITYTVNPLDAIAEEWTDVTLDYFDDDLLAASIAMDSAVFVSSHKLEAAGDLLVTGGDSSSIFVDQLVVGGNLIVDANTTLVVRSAQGVSVTGDVILQEGAQLTVPNASGDNFYPLALDIAGALKVADGASVDLNGKGYLNQYTGGPDANGDNWACHGGLRIKDRNRNCIYGRYQKAGFAGGSGDKQNSTNTSAGGGVVSVKAQSVELSGSGAIRANGLPGDYDAGGAGGGVHIETELLTGSGSIEARGGKGRRDHAGGGRISLYVSDDSGFSGKLRADSGSSAGAGTVYIRRPGDTYGELVVDNFGVTAAGRTTPLPNVGRHRIESVTQLAEDRWEITVAGSPWKPSSAEYAWGVDGYWVVLDADREAAPRYQIEENGSNTLIITTADDLSAYVGSELVGVHILDRLTVRNGAWLDIGEDRLQLVQVAQSTISSATVSANILPQNVIELALTQGGGIVTEQPVELFEMNLTGTGQATIDTPSLTVTGDVQISGLDADNKLTVILALDETMHVGGNLSISDAVLTVPYANASSKKIYTLAMDVAGHVSVAEGAKIDVTGKGYPSGDYYGPEFKQWEDRSSAHGGSRRHLGYTYGRYERARFAGSAGDWENSSMPGHGGGVVELLASSLELNGDILAEGTPGEHRGGGGGSVHIEVGSFTGEGTALISANGGGQYHHCNTCSNYSSGAGGRISIYTADHSGYLGTMAAASGSGDFAGAGTIYIQDPLGQFGHLSVDNADHIGQLGSTPLRHVGRHQIIDVYQPTAGVWKVEVAGSPWKDSDNPYGYGVDGLWVDLDASETESPRYRVVSNRENVLEIHTSDNLLPVVGKELVGEHIFDSLKVTGGASLDVGDDRLTVLDIEQSTVSGNGQVVGSLISEAVVQQSIRDGGRIFSSSPIVLQELLLDYTEKPAVASLIDAPKLTVVGDVQLNNAWLSVALDSGFNVAGSMHLQGTSEITVPNANASQEIIYPLSLLVAGQVVVDELARIDVTGKGYPAEDYYGPGFGKWSDRSSAHGGSRRHISYAYGRYEHARFAGSAGDWENASMPGHGGGIVELFGTHLELNGKIVVQGMAGEHRGGAGGSVHIEVDSLSGQSAALISADGGGQYHHCDTCSGYSSGAGGRISIYTADKSSYLGSLSAASAGGDIAGAGTIYVQDPLQQFGHLTVDNADRVAESSSTPLRNVGRHQIVGAYQPTTGVWKVEVAGSPWKDSDNPYGYGVDGLWVDLDASETASSHYRIVSNRENVLEIHTSDDLHSIVGKKLVGVQTFATVQLLGGSSLDIGEDRLVVLDTANSQFVANSSLLAGELSQDLIQLAGQGGASVTLRNTPQLSNVVLDNLGESTLRFSDKVTVDQLTISSGKVYFDSGLEVAGGLSVGGSAYVRSLAVNAQGLTLSGDATFEASVVDLPEHLSLQDQSVLTAPYADASQKIIYSLTLSVGGNVSIDELAKIDVTGKGYPPNDYYGPAFGQWSEQSSGHGGSRRHRNNAFGRYERARFAGSAGYWYDGSSRGYGGGVIELFAAGLELNGQILADGEKGNHRGGAGGSIHIEVDTIVGQGTALVAADGGGQRSTSSGNDRYAAGAGGRISIYTGDHSGYLGTMSAVSGSGDISGAGTIYIQNPPQQFGHLMVDNADRIAQSGSTPLRNVGRHQIVGAYQPTAGVWKVEVAGSPWKDSGNPYGYGVDGLWVDLDASETASSHYRIISNRENVLEIHTSDDLYSAVGKELVGVQTFATVQLLGGSSLDIGEDRLVVLDTASSRFTANSTLLAGELSQDLIQLAGQGGATVTLRNTPQLSNLVLDNLGESTLRFSDKVTVDQLSISSGKVYFDNGLEVAGELTIGGSAYVRSLVINAQNLNLVGDANLETSVVDLPGDLSLQDQSVLTAPYADASLKAIYPLTLSVGGNVSIGELAKVDVSGKGYPSNDYYGPEFKQWGEQASGHGGSRRHRNTAYGRFERARIAGSAGYLYDGSSRGYGGGVIELFAAGLELDGQILADGEKGNHRGGAGGSIHIEVDTIVGQGTALVAADGGGQRSVSSGNDRYAAGAGGRISIYTSDHSSYLGTMSAVSGSGDISGAGTIYIQDPLQQFGHLTIDNADRIAQSGSTPLRSVGRHQIVGAYQPTAGVWKVEVAGSPWKDSDNLYGYGVDGLWVDLDASETASTHYQIVSNNKNALEIHTSDDLYSVVGKELVGVQTFATVQLLGGSSLDIGEDRLVVLDTANSQFAANSSLLAGELSQDLIQLAGEGGATVTLRNTPQLSNLVLDNLGESTLRFSEKVTIDRLSISSGKVHFDNGLEVAGELSISGDATVQALTIDAGQLLINDGQLISESVSLLGDFMLGAGAEVTVPSANITAKHIYRLQVVADGRMTIAETASIDVAGKGYPNNYYYGPDFASNSGRTSGHGGHRRHGKSAFGRYENAYYAGSGGDASGSAYPGHGGGAVDISVAELVVDGSIVADGQGGYVRGGAGGSVYIEAASLAGASSGLISTNGGGQRYHSSSSSSYSAGAGGRISIYTGSKEGYLGSISSTSGPGDIAGAGTVYLHDLADSVGSLIVDNGGQAAQENSTPIRSVGEHQITAVEQLSANRWRVSVAEDVWQPSGDSLDKGLDGLLVSLDSQNPDAALYPVVSNHVSSLMVETFDDLNGAVGNNLVGVHLFKSITIANGASVDWGGDNYLELGDQVAARDSDGDGLSDADETDLHQTDIHDPDTDKDGVPDGLEVAIGSSPLVPGDADITPYVTSLVYEPADRIVDLEVDSNIVEFDLGVVVEVDGHSYPLGINSQDLFAVAFGSDSAVAQHQVDGLYLLEEGSTNLTAEFAGLEAQVTVHVSGPQLQNWASQTVDLNSDRQVHALTLNNSIVNGLDYRLQVNGDVVISGSEPVRVSLRKLAVAGNFVIDGATVTLDSIEGLEVAGEVVVKNGATITVPSSSVAEKRVSVLTITADRIQIEEGSKLDASGRGYPGTGDGGYSWPRYQTSWFDSGYSSCHGGNRRSGDVCSYGRYERAQFAGSAGDYWNTDRPGNGGGVVELVARELLIDGSVLANGSEGYHTGGAGGSVHLETEVLKGSGLLQVNGGRNHRSYSDSGNLSGAGTGGRISVYAVDRRGFSGRYQAASGSYQHSGAGTIYLHNPNESHGHLLVDNIDRTAPQGSTPIRMVGRHLITGVDVIDTGVWRVEVEGEPWEATDELLQRGIAGIEVDLDAADKSGPLYRIERNTTNTITLHTADDLSAIVGQELVGVHAFDTVTVSGGASLDLGDDRLVLLDPAGSDIAFGSSLVVGELDEVSMQVFTPSAYEQGGLWGTYYDNQDFTAKRFSRVDEQIDFDWNSGQPDGLQHDYFSIRWQGELEVPETTDYAFSGRSDTTVRVWIDGNLIVDAGCCGDYTAEPISLTAGRHRILVEYTQAASEDFISLRWSYGSVSEELIPASAFYFRNPGVNGRIILTQVHQLEETELYASDEQPITFNQSVSSNGLTLQSGAFVFNGDLIVNGPLVLAELTELTVRGQLYAESIRLTDRALLNTSKVESIGSIELFGGAEIRGFYPDTGARQIRSLQLLADTIIVSEQARIDVSGRGYPGKDNYGYTWPDYQTSWFDSGYSTCHGGNRRSGDVCSYGRYERAQFAGSAGYYRNGTDTANGGGVIELAAREMIIDGSVLASGRAGHETGGAGGSIHLETEVLQGSGLLRANGGRNHSGYSDNGNLSSAGTGGRISVYVTDRSGFSGRFQAASGSYHPSGAGTVYLRNPNESHGHLLVDNIGLSAPQGSTPIRSVGRHLITGADLVDTGVWRIEVEGQPWQVSDESLQRGIVGIDVDLDAADKSGPLYRIERNTANTITLHTADDLSAIVGRELVGVHTFDTVTVSGGASLDLGDDRLVLLDPAGSDIAFGSSLQVGELDEVSMQVFTPSAYEQGGLWGTYYDNQDFTAKRFSRVDEQIDFDWNSGQPDGLQHDYFSIRWQGELEVPETTDYAFSGRSDTTVRVWIDGNLIVDAGCCGDYTAEPVSLTAGRHRILVEYTQAASEDFISLRWSYGSVSEELIPASAFYFRNPGILGQLVLSETVELSESELHSTPEQPLTFIRPVVASDLMLLEGTFIFKGGLQVSGTLLLDSFADVQVEQTLTADSLALVNRSRLTAKHVVADHMLVSGGSEVIGVGGNTESKAIHPLLLEVSGTLEVDAESTIDVSGKGFPTNDWSGPDFGSQSRAGCHGGIRNNTTADCTYGRYERARFAGSAGRHYNSDNPGDGGGLIELRASSVELDGTIRANGRSGGYASGSYAAGAGGSIHIETMNFSGTGALETIGGSNARSGNYPAGAGGRISLYVENDTFSGDLHVHGGAGGTVSGSGTAYIRQPSATYGHLVVDNAGRFANDGSTPVRHVGRHVITGVDQVAAGEWRIEVAGEPWKPTDVEQGWGIDGIDVDLDATENASTHYLVERNTANTITVKTDDDLSSVLGQELVGVHNLETITVTGGASVDFGEDKLVVRDLENSHIDSSARVRAGWLDHYFLASVLQSQGRVELSHPLVLEALTLDSVTNAVLKAPSVSVNGDVTLTNSALLLDTESLTVANNLALVSSSLTVPSAQSAAKELRVLDITVGGLLDIDSASEIDVSGKGYPTEDWSGPDFENQSRGGCHGGIRNNTNVDCTYGRYERASFAGSAGRYYNSGNGGYGGGVVELYVATLNLDGAILANGWNGGNSSGSYAAGAGGAVHIEAQSFGGTGVVEAAGGSNGRSSSYPAGAGGRISIYTDADSFTGEFRVNGGVGGTVSGAGTAYVQQLSQTYGHLIVNNANRRAKDGSTPIRTIGRHKIVGVDEVAAGEWRIEVEGDPWKPTDRERGWGVDGIVVDLQASDTSSPHYLVERNTKNTLTLRTGDDLSSVVGLELVGVHTFNAVTVTGGASVDFGEDRLVVLSPTASYIDAQSTVRSAEQLWDGSLVLDGQSWSLSNRDQILRINGDLTLINGATLSAPTAQTSSKSTYGIRLEVAGVVSVDADSAIDVSGKGYPNDNWSGPDYETQSRGGCHGGIRSNTSADCTYGRYERARFAGSGGHYYNGSNRGYGGGVIELYAAGVNLEGAIRANGWNGGYPSGSYAAGAGGAIHIEAQSFSGAGVLESVGGSNAYSSSYPAGAGGRISVYTDVDSFTGEFHVNGGTGGAVSGAGTAYVQQLSQTYGHLIVNNANRRAKNGSTPIRSIGRHEITGVDEVAAGEWRIEVAGEPWKPIDSERGWGIDGIVVDLQAGDTSSSHYLVERNTNNTITVVTSDDLSIVVGQELVGVHTFEAVTVTGGASVDFGEDRLIIRDPSASYIDSQSTVHSGEQQWDGSLVLDGREWSLSNRNQLLRINGDLTLINGATLSAPTAQTSSKSIYGIRLEVTGVVNVDATSVIDVSGKGYPNDNWSGPDYETQSRGGCHGGIRSNTSADCTYGRYERARFAGSGGRYYNGSNQGYGGGVVELYAAGVNLEGAIRANGWNGGYHNGTQVAGAGGAIHIEAQSFSGVGVLQAVGGSNTYSGSYPAGAGGRISVYTEIDDFTGKLEVNGGTGGSVSGAGTAFVQPLLQSYGHLIVDNANRMAKDGSTPIRSIGRHTITAVEQISADQWRIHVAEDVWQPTDSRFGWGIDGIAVDLDASEIASPHYLVESNNASSFTLRTEDDLSGAVGQELVGVHTFETIRVTGGASLDFGEDKLVVLDLENSQIGGGAQIRAGWLDHQLLVVALKSQGRVEASHPLTLAALSLEGVADAVLKAPSIEVSGDVDLVDTSLILDVGSFDAVGNLSLVSSSLTAPHAQTSTKSVQVLDIAVGGLLDIDSASSIDVSGKGYPNDDWSGPDFESQSRGGCHGGIRNNSAADCTYGRYERAHFAGSGGRYWNASNRGYGGGVVELRAVNINVDGAIRANGWNGGYPSGSRAAGAGGAIHIESQVFTGTGSLEATGGSNVYSTSYPTGAGGRISVYTDTDSFAGKFRVSGGSSGAVSGAGTAYVQKFAEDYGHLIVDNANRRANDGSTPIRNVGRHSIVAVEEVEPGEWNIQVADTPWLPTDSEHGWGIDGMAVDLNANGDVSTHYLVEHNTENTLTLLTEDDLSGIVGQELVGVHTFETVTITGGASVDFGEDRLVVRNPAGSHIDSQSELHSSEQLWDGPLVLDNQSWTLSNGNQVVRVNGDLTLLNGAMVTAPIAREASKSIYSVRLEVVGAVSIDEGSAIDVSGKGYPDPDWSGPDFETQSRAGCHGGIRSNTSEDCTYGRYERARFAGSGGRYWNASNRGYGGGVVELMAASVKVDGAIRANGWNGGYPSGSRAAGAGGAIHIESQIFTGTGSLEATGGSNVYSTSYPAGAGGRISVYTDTDSFSGKFRVSGGSSGAVSGAGTAYVQQFAEDYGHLIVDNADRQAAVGSTPVRTVGRHTINAVELIAEGQWRIQVAGEPWRPSDSQRGWGLDGIAVDLSADETVSHHYLVESNTENTLTILTDDDLSGMAGQELVGVHTFETVTVTGGASVDFGEDRLVIRNPADSYIDSQSVVLSREQLWEGSLVLDNQSWSLSNLNQLVQINGDLTLRNGATVSAPLAQAPSKSLYGVRLEVAGAVNIDETSVVDVSGKGYPDSDWSGPDFQTQSRAGCHGGIRNNTSEDCTYGRYERSRFAGSGGRYWNTSNRGYGGGVVELLAASVNVDGAIRANGWNGGYPSGSRAAGAGGAIHIESQVFTGTGSLEATGGSNVYSSSYPAGAGGRISVYTETDNFTGKYLAHGGTGGAVSGAGTTFIQQLSQSYGRLLVDSGSRQAKEGSTPIRSIGRHMITAVDQPTLGEWKIQIADEPWLPSDTELDWGLDGIEVDLDASETASPHYLVESNSASTLTLRTQDDLSNVIGQELVGVHTFEAVTVTGGASVSFGDDRLELIDISNLLVDSTSSVISESSTSQ
nr:PA14 domain-containing protein [Microbulbifer rhizosphaerae]